ncbi:unnamed protein product [Spirodela intermedia]|uniref:Uncharacterized protein n=1 Tax=Spirodela intermedia TaxID=51605 RepID=A0A7I8JDG4_SPIIN|nr:unnamed protein product [Spirodela intermedia]CAA6667563.1 unnamed protein product [Spirodela intermedia]
MAGGYRFPRITNQRIVRSDAVVPIVGEKFCRASEERQLTVQKTSLFYPGDGFAVYEHQRWRHVGLVFRVDSYGYDSHHVMGRRAPARDEVVLMGPCGDCILTVRRKVGRVPGEKVDGQKPLFSARRHSIVGNSAGIFVEVYGMGGTGHREYRVEGSFSQRCCTVYYAHSDGVSTLTEAEEGSAAVVAEIRRKVVVSSASSAADVVSDNMVLGKDVFCLRLAPGFDAAFSMGLVLMLDQITGDNV